MSADTEQQLRAEWRARGLLQWAAIEGARDQPVDALLRAVLDQICSVTGWPVGHALRLGDDGAVGSTGIWHLDDASRFATFRAASEDMRFAPGQGMPGRVLASGEPLWIPDVAKDANFPRNAAATDLGVHAAFAFPLIFRDRVVAVLEFFAAAPVPPDVPFLEVLWTLGVVLGSLIERARSEDALRAAEERLRAFTDTATDAIVSADAGGRVVTWNRAAERLFGFSLEEVRGQDLSMIIPRRHRMAHEAGMARVGAGGEARVIGKTVELSALCKDGREIPVELSLATWTVRGARFYGGILRDISERKRSAEELALSERRAVEASRAKSAFLANMSHELRTPLNAILGYVQLLQRDAGVGDEQRRSLDVIARSGEHLLGLINDVLSLAKIESGERNVQAADFDLRRLLEGLQDMFALPARQKGLALRFDVDAALPQRVHGDEGKLRQVLINLLGNAVKLTATGSVALVARGGASDGRAHFDVEDTGPGIAADEVPRLFQPFVQVGDQKQAQAGTGLGLAISRDFVRQLGGELAVASEVGRGTRFSFSVDLPPAQGEHHDARPARRVVRLADSEPERRVLVVDNDDDSRELLARLLASVGFVVHEAENGARAVDEWQTFHPMIVWMDMRMPVMNGYDAVRAIRALERDAGTAARGTSAPTVICALTASAFEHDRASILAAGCDDVLSKPFREEILFAVMEQRMGARFDYEDARAAGDGPLARLAAAPPDVRVGLRAALVAGDDLQARIWARRLDDVDAALSLEVVRRIAAFELDALIDELDRLA